MSSEILPFGHPAWIEIDLNQFKQNLRCLRQYLGNTKLCIPIKANAYGHGLIAIGRAAAQAGVDYLAVSCLQEGAQLRAAGIQIPILVLGAIHEEQIPALLDYQLEFSISSQFKAELAAKKSIALQKKCRVHIEIDTGMQRTGVRPQTAINLLNYLQATQCFEVVGIYSHLATGDTPHNADAEQQIQLFKSFVDQHIKNKHPQMICHLANSGGVCYYPDAIFDMVRPGLLALGYFPSQHKDELAAIAPFFSVKAKAAYFKAVAAGQGISYGHTYKTASNTRIVTVPVGYGDGYRRDLSNKGRVLLHGKSYPIAGVICMDQFMVDINHDPAYVGDEVTLIGRQGSAEISLLEIARLCNTIPYEILCGFNNRLPRVYQEDDQRFCEL